MRAQDKIVKKSLAKISAYKRVFSGLDGELVLKDLMATHSVMTSTFVSKDVNEMLIKEGERNVVLRILKLLNIDEAQLKERIESYEKEMG